MVAGFGLAFLALVAVGLLAFGTIGASLVGEVASRSGTGETNELPRFTLEVADDGCGVVRSPTAPTPDSLTWVVTDEEGFQVLGRRANSETRFRYFAGGNFEVVLSASDGRGYVDVSNRVSISCGV